MPNSIKNTKVTIGILTYNHEKYIEECLASVVSQSGDFDLRIIIVNDRSKDNTDDVIKRFIANNKHIDIEYDVNENNLGAQKSIYKTLGLIKKTKPNYWAYIEGDDKYLSSDRTQKHIDLLKSNKSAIMSYNKLLLIDEHSKAITKHEPKSLEKVLSTEQLAAQNHIGSFCATFYSAKSFDFFNVNEFEGLTVYDWFFNIWMSQFGEIRLLPEYLSGYRQHSTSVWSSKSHADKYWELIWSIDAYNKKLNFLYDDSFQLYKRNLINQLSVIGNDMRLGIALVSGKFPAINDDFVNGEIKYILEKNENIAIIASGEKKEAGKLKNSIQKYKQDHPDIANKIIGYNGSYSVRARCIYAVSIDDAYFNALPISNNYDTLLVFEICSADEKTVKNADAILRKRLKAIFNSVNFVKVIVHNEEIKKYFVDNKFCKEESVALIPSSVSGIIFSKEEMQSAGRMESYYFQINNILRRCVDGKIQPPPRHTVKKLIIFYHKAKPKAIRKAKTLVRSNRLTLFIARTVYKPIRLINRSKGVK